MDFSSSPKEEEKNFLHFYGEMDDDDFHKMMSVDDLTYSIAFSDEVFDNGEWHTYTCLETCNVIKPTRHGKETLGKGVQSNPAKGVSGNSNLTCLSGDDTKLGTDHTKADVYESSNNVSVSSSISENQMQSDSDLEDDLFSLAEDNDICSDSDDGSYFLADERLEEVLDASFNPFDTFGSTALSIGTHLNYHWECTCSRLVLLRLIYLKCIVDFIVLLFYLARVV